MKITIATAENTYTLKPEELAQQFGEYLKEELILDERTVEVQSDRLQDFLESYDTNP